LYTAGSIVFAACSVAVKYMSSSDLHIALCWFDILLKWHQTSLSVFLTYYVQTKTALPSAPCHMLGKV